MEYSGMAGSAVVGTAVPLHCSIYQSGKAQEKEGPTEKECIRIRSYMYRRRMERGEERERERGVDMKADTSRHHRGGRDNRN